MARQNDIEHFHDLMDRGLMTADQVNVAIVKMDRVRVIVGRVPIQVRRALNAAVKAGELGHMAKAHPKPEVYYHPTFKQMAIAARNEAEREHIAALQRYAGFPK